MSKKGIKGGSASDFCTVLDAQESSLSKLECFINTIDILIVNKGHVPLSLDLIEACRETVTELGQCTAKLHVLRLYQERPNTPTSQTSKGGHCNE